MSEYELTNLRPITNYIVIVKLYNEAGVADQSFRITTLSERSKGIFLHLSFVNLNIHKS